MRIALLSILENDLTPGAFRPAFARYAGAMVVEHQLELALKLGCERIAVLVDSIEREVVELQARAEKAGVKFRAIREPSELAGTITADDEVLVMASGILPEDDTVEEALCSKGVLTFPADLAVPLGYERIDLELAWAGVMILPGHLVERLGDLPSDVDVPSSLMRLGLQSGVRLKALDRSVLADGQWHLNADRPALELREKQWIDAQRKEISFRAPGLAVAERAGARLARDVIGQSAQRVPMLASVLGIFSAIGAGVFGHAALGLGLLTIAVLFGHMAGVVERVAALGRPKGKGNSFLRALGHLVDPAFLFLLAAAAPTELGYMRVFIPLMLLGLLRLGERHSSPDWQATYADRISLGFLLAAATFAGFSTETAALFALVALITRFFSTFRGD